MSLTSMTGYGHASHEGEGLQLQVEIRSVNHRFLDLNWKLPGIFSRHEQPFSKIVREYVRRGRLDIAVYRTANRAVDVSVSLNEAALTAAAQQVKAALGTVGAATPEAYQQAVIQLLQRREILDIGSDSDDVELEIPAVEAVLRKALEAFAAMRLQEGNSLTAALTAQLAVFGDLLERLEQEAGAQSTEMAQRLKDRISKLLGEVPLDENRLAQEIVILADRTDITEEIGRMKSHVDQLQHCFRAGESGKKIEFLLQELGREVNTSGSKSQRSSISAIVVSMKVELEKMREQIQNIE